MIHKQGKVLQKNAKFAEIFRKYRLRRAEENLGGSCAVCDKDARTKKEGFRSEVASVN